MNASLGSAGASATRGHPEHGGLPPAWRAHGAQGRLSRSRDVYSGALRANLPAVSRSAPSADDEAIGTAQSGAAPPLSRPRNRTRACRQLGGDNPGDEPGRRGGDSAPCAIYDPPITRPAARCSASGSRASPFCQGVRQSDKRGSGRYRHLLDRCSSPRLKTARPLRTVSTSLSGMYLGMSEIPPLRARERRAPSWSTGTCTVKTVGNRSCARGDEGRGSRPRARPKAAICQELAVTRGELGS